MYIFKKFNCNVNIYDPWVNKKEVNDEYNIQLIDKPIKNNYDAIVLAVVHDEFKTLSEKQIRAYGKVNHESLKEMCWMKKNILVKTLK